MTEAKRVMAVIIVVYRSGDNGNISSFTNRYDVEDMAEILKLLNLQEGISYSI
jgi:hypothetical protein